MFKQKFRDRSLNLGHSNSKFSYSILKTNKKRSFICSSTSADGFSVSCPSQIEVPFVDNFKSILAPEINNQFRDLDLQSVVTTAKVEVAEALLLSRDVEVAEIVRAISEDNPSKYPGPDGFNAHLFKV